MAKMSSTSTLIFVIMLSLTHSMIMCCSGKEVTNATSGCVSSERSALLKLKESFSDPSNRLSSWNTSTDCCRWQGIVCEKLTRHVIALDLRDELLSSEMVDMSILGLKHLRYLDLSGNDFHQSSIPSFLGLMNQLQHLNLSFASFRGVVPHHLGNLSRLSVLDLSNSIFRRGQLIVDDFTWVSCLSLLTHLDMSAVDLKQTNDLLKVLNMLPSIEVLRLSYSGVDNRNLGDACVNSSLSSVEELDLSSNELDGELPCFLENMTSLRYLNLGYNKYNHVLGQFPYGFNKLELLHLQGNNISGHIPNSIGNFSVLTSLDLSFNRKLTGSIPSSIGNLRALEYLDLSFSKLSGLIPPSIGNLTALSLLNLNVNQISGLIPSSIGNLSGLIELRLSSNQLSGHIPISIGQLSNIELLSVGDNYLDGMIFEAHFLRLSKLQRLWMDRTFMKFRIGTDWMPPFQLQILDIRSCEIVGGQFPQWLRNQNELYYLSMSNCSISGTVPHWLFHSINMSLMDLSLNQIQGSLPASLCEMESVAYLDLSSNRLSGNLPECWPNSINQIRLRNNLLTGEVPSGLGNCTQLIVLDLSRNGLSGHLPEFLVNLHRLSILILASNKLSGVIPKSVGGAYALEWLQLSNNSFSGELPSTMINCTALIVLDVGDNSISGELPKWIGNNLLSLNILRLRNNEFNGTLPTQLCQLSLLRILDLASNNFAGNIPLCFDNFSYMISYNSSVQYFLERYSLLQVIKGIVQEYFRTLSYVVNMDLSENNLVGEIPLELTKLAALNFLNLSHNHLQGSIPGRIGDMKLLESLDLSNNDLSGNIPMSLSELTFLSHLNLSQNNLTGEIPTGPQLRTLEEPSIYEGNSGLCGPPLLKKCHEGKPSESPNAGHASGGGDDEVEKILFYGVITSGFVTGFWGAIGVLVFKRSWRHIYFGFTDGVIARVLGR